MFNKTCGNVYQEFVHKINIEGLNVYKSKHQIQLLNDIHQSMGYTRVANPLQQYWLLYLAARRTIKPRPVYLRFTAGLPWTRCHSFSPFYCSADENILQPVLGSYLKSHVCLLATSQCQIQWDYHESESSYYPSGTLLKQLLVSATHTKHFQSSGNPFVSSDGGVMQAVLDYFVNSLWLWLANPLRNKDRETNFAKTISSHKSDLM